MHRFVLYILQSNNPDNGVKAIHFVFVVQVPSGRTSGLREDGNVGTRDIAAGDPAGLRDQVSILVSNNLSSKLSNLLHNIHVQLQKLFILSTQVDDCQFCLFLYINYQVASLFDEWASICDAPGTSDKAYAVYVSHLQHSGMLKGDDISDRFFRILIVSDLFVLLPWFRETQVSKRYFEDHVLFIVSNLEF